jgi:transposase
MNAYSEDLRKKIVEAAERGTPKTEVARAFGVGVSSVKRYVATSREGRSLELPRSVLVRGRSSTRGRGGS